MTDPEPSPAATLVPKTVGERLRLAREREGLDLADISARTRIPARSLQAVEDGDYPSLKAPTYAVGFARAYARAVGVDEVAVARDVRAEMGGSFVRRPEDDPFDAPDPSRVPPRGVMLASVLAGILALVAIGLWYGTSLFRGEHAPAPAAPASEAMAVPPAAVVAAPAPSPGGQVTLTAADEVWLRIYDGAGKTLFQGTMKPGDHYDVPADASGPMINVGRPDKLQVTVNGSSVPALGDGRVAIKDVAISADALLARGATATAPAAAPAPGPTTTRATGRAANDAVPPAFRARRSDAPAGADAGRRPTPAPATTPGPASSSRVGADTPVAPPAGNTQ